jgi:predicted nicotinamide N-methyase
VRRWSPCGPRIVAGYPTRQLSLQLGDIHVGLLTVARLEDYVDTAALLRDADAPEPPYWAHLWTGSRALARLVATQIACAGRRVVEIGCGLGLAGIVAARRGATATLIDSAWEGVCFAAANVTLNGCRAHVIQSDLRSPGLRAEFDYCLAAEVTYDPLLQRAVATFLAEHLAPRGRAWCAESVRTTDGRFRVTCESLGLEVSERDVLEPEDGRDIQVRITEVRRATGAGIDAC